MMMSDIPWAVAWYGNTPCLTLAKNIPDFERINKGFRPISAIYLTLWTLAPLMPYNTLEGDPGAPGVWVSLLLLRQPPEHFPLRVTASQLPPGILFLTDRVRWQPGGG